MPEPQNRVVGPDRGLFDRQEFRDLALHLCARLAQGTATLGALQNTLRKGALIQLETPVGEPARLLANGHPIASGELVAVKGRMSFRITKLGGDDD